MDAFWGYLQIDAFGGTCKLEPCKLMEHFVYIYSILFCSGTGPNDIKNVLGIANEIIDYNLAIFYAHISDRSIINSISSSPFPGEWGVGLESSKLLIMV